VDFVLFILVAAILFIRPTDFVPGLEQAPLYLIAIVPCMILSWQKLIPQVTTAGLRERPVLVFGIGLIFSAVFSSVVYMQVQAAFNFAVDLPRVLVLYMLILAQLDSPGRLKRFIGCLVGIMLIPILLVVLNYHGTINIEAFKLITGPDGDRRLSGQGTFGDPNDMCEIVNCAMIFSLCGLLNRGSGLVRVIWLAPLAVFGHALALTQSKGGFLATLVGLMVLFRSRFGTKKALIVAGLVLPLMLTVYAGRQTTFDVSDGASQSRIQLWDAGFDLFRRSPVTAVIGIGLNGFYENVSHVAHNAFIQVYTELGFIGGTLLFGQYFYCLRNLIKLGSKRVAIPDPEMRRLYPFIMAALASFTTSEMSLTNCFGVATYMILGLATVCIRLSDPSPPLPDLLLSRKLVKQTIICSGLFLAGLYVFTKVNVRYA